MAAGGWSPDAVCRRLGLRWGCRLVALLGMGLPHCSASLELPPRTKRMLSGSFRCRSVPWDCARRFSGPRPRYLRLDMPDWPVLMNTGGNGFGMLAPLLRHGWARPTGGRPPLSWHVAHARSVECCGSASGLHRRRRRQGSPRLGNNDVLTIVMSSSTGPLPARTPWPAAAAINCRNKRPSKLDSEWAVVIDSGDTSCATRQNQHRAPSSHFADYGLRVCRPRAAGRAVLRESAQAIGY